MRTFDVAVLGTGPVGLVAALRISRAGRTVIVITKRLPGPDDLPRVDAVPAGFLAFLVELGIPPTVVGADRLHDVRLAAWESEKPFASNTAKTAHLERPALDLALLDLVLRTNRIPIEFEHRKLRTGGGVAGDGWRAAFVIDATGRAAVTATKRIRPPRPWVARTFWTSRTACEADAALSIAALPGGYAYRLGAASIMTLGVVGRGAAVSGSPFAVESHLRSYAPWLMEGWPALADMKPGPTRSACVQSTEGETTLRIGDASLARDALASQGIAAGISEALLAAAVTGGNDLALCRARQREQYRAHLTSLLQVLDRSRYSGQAAWRDYRAFVAQHVEPAPLSSIAALRDGRIEATSAAGVSS